jgi:phage shock protein PspC (stress-responsive transcriptional regulator)
MLTGVAGGLGERLAVDPALVRAAFVVLATAGGVGVVAYLVLYALAADPPPPGSGAGRQTGREPTATSAAALGLVVLGSLLLLRDLGLWFGNALVWPVALAAFGSAVVWGRGDDAERDRLARLAARIPGNPLRWLFAPGAATLVRVGVGGLLVALGLVALLPTGPGIRDAPDGLLAILFTMAGTVLVLWPAILRLARQVNDERYERIRSEERAEMAAHLHDSVLQTLALIQRSGDARETAALARAQERELRAWLYGRGAAEEDLLSSAVESLASRVEQLHHVKVEVVVVGDRPLDPRGRAVVRAAGEALHNAARHSGAEAVSVYVESGADGLHAYVTDEGRGFDPTAVPPDRRGIADSIVGRVERHGGTVTITSDPGEGTEVHLHVPETT